MSGSRVAVLVRTYFWDDFAFRSTTRIWDRSGGLDVYVLADETHSGALDVGPFPKLGHDTRYFERLGLPCAASGQGAALWWNCDYGLYDATLRLPEYDHYLLIEGDVAVNLDLRPLVEQAVAAGTDCLTLAEHHAIHDGWTFAPSCADLPYARRTWTPLCIMLISRRAACHLLAERRRLAALRAAGRLVEWAFCEGFVSSALLDAGLSVATLRGSADLRHFGTEAVYLETDPRTRRPGSLCHAVLDADRFWPKFIGRGFWRMLADAQYDGIRQTREQLTRIGRTEQDGWRIAGGERSLALDRPARQSSLSAWSRRGRPGHPDPNALDARGANCGVLTGGYAFHTELEDGPWWAVDLGRDCAVEEVRVTNSRLMPERARRLLLQVSDDGEAWVEVFRNAGERVFAGIDDPLVWRPPHPVTARHVRVMLAGPGVLHLSQVEVFGT